jgi:hypothetical protein
MKWIVSTFGIVAVVGLVVGPSDAFTGLEANHVINDAGILGDIGAEVEQNVRYPRYFFWFRTSHFTAY